MPKDKIAYTINEARAAIGIGRTTLYKEIGAGNLPVRKLNGRTLILADDLRAYAESLPGAA